jgi:hypothetical protein
VTIIELGGRGRETAQRTKKSATKEYESKSFLDEKELKD